MGRNGPAQLFRDLTFLRMSSHSGRASITAPSLRLAHRHKRVPEPDIVLDPDAKRPSLPAPERRRDVDVVLQRLARERLAVAEIDVAVAVAALGQVLPGLPKAFNAGQQGRGLDLLPQVLLQLARHAHLPKFIDTGAIEGGADMRPERTRLQRMKARS